MQFTPRALHGKQALLLGVERGRAVLCPERISNYQLANAGTLAVPLNFNNQLLRPARFADLALYFSVLLALAAAPLLANGLTANYAAFPGKLMAPIFSLLATMPSFIALANSRPLASAPDCPAILPADCLPRSGR